MCQIIEFQYLGKTETVTVKFQKKKNPKKPNSKEQKDVLMAVEMPESNAGHHEFPEQLPFQSDVQFVN